jgi:crotonobetainyl-CoA:carnitine CoA-transferase CaiB-like acyl-CoA transferase
MNDAQFGRVARLLGHPEWASDPRFARNGGRVDHRDDLIELMSARLLTRGSLAWLSELEAANVPAGPINRISDLTDDPQLSAREMVVSFPDAVKGVVKTAGNPVKLSGTPVRYSLPPPAIGEHTHDILSRELGMSNAEIATLRARSII